MTVTLHSFNEMKWSKDLRQFSNYDTITINSKINNNKIINLDFHNYHVQSSPLFTGTFSKVKRHVYHFSIKPKSQFYKVEPDDNIEQLDPLPDFKENKFSDEDIDFSFDSPFSFTIKQHGLNTYVKISDILSSKNSWNVTFGSTDLNLIGIPERSGPLFLEPSIIDNTIINNPYRLFNCDTGEWRPPPQFSVYGSIPFLSSSHAAVYLANASDTFVDLILKSNEHEITAHFTSEYPPIDIFIYIGPRNQTTPLFKDQCGHTFIPTPSDFGFNHCKWGLASQKEAEEVIKVYDENNIPFDALWLDIDHLNENRPLTWNYNRFPNPSQLKEQLHKKGRKLAQIVDPHISIRSLESTDAVLDSNNPHLESPLINPNLCMKKDGKTFIGHCWPGSSVWPDFLNESTRQWWMDQIKKSKIDIIWNDMNEPSVFNFEEITFPRGTQHIDGIDHFSCHNIYGYWMSCATRLASNSLVLTRSFFAGSQKYAAIWTGDCLTSWESLQQSIATLMTLSICGISYAGADIGGFFGDPSEELLERWFEIAVWIYPFLRCHGHIAVPSRHHRIAKSNQIKMALHHRYKMIPYWQVSFALDAQNGLPVVRPVFYDFPESELKESEAVLFGNFLLVMLSCDESGVITKDPLVNYVEMADFNEKHVKVFLKTGSIIPVTHDVSESAESTLNSGIDLLISLDTTGYAHGFICDSNNSSVLIDIQFKDGKIICENEMIPKMTKIFL